MGRPWRDRVAITGDACEEWVIADLGAQSLGAITYGIYPTASVSEVEYQMRQGAASVFVAENQEYVVEIDFDTVASWARANGIACTGFADLIRNEAVKSLIARQIDKANAQLSPRGIDSRCTAILSSGESKDGPWDCGTSRFSTSSCATPGSIPTALRFQPMPSEW